MPNQTEVERLLAIDHAPDGLDCACGEPMRRRRESGELGFLWKFDHEAHRTHLATVIAGIAQ